MSMELEREQTRFLPEIESMNREQLINEIIRTELLLNESHSRPFEVMVLNYLNDLTIQFDMLDKELERGRE